MKQILSLLLVFLALGTKGSGFIGGAGSGTTITNDFTTFVTTNNAGQVVLTNAANIFKGVGSGLTGILNTGIATNNSVQGQVLGNLGNGTVGWTDGGLLTNVIPRGTFTSSTVNIPFVIGQLVTNTGKTFVSYLIRCQNSGSLANRFADCYVFHDGVTNIYPFSPAGNVLTQIGTNYFNPRVPAGGWWTVTNAVNVTGLTFDTSTE